MTRKVRVALYGNLNRVALLDADATQGATIGTDLRLPNGTVPTLAQLAALFLAAQVPVIPPSTPTVIWGTIQEIPPNVVEVANLSTSGIVVRQASGDWITRAITVVDVDRLTIVNGDGDAGAPTLDTGPDVALLSRDPQTFLGLNIFPASDITSAGLRLPHGVAPSAPVNGDFWTTTGGLYFQINGATVGPIAAAVNSSIPTTVQGDLLYASGANVLAALPKNASATRYLSNTGASNNPAWAQVDLTNGVTGLLPDANLSANVALLDRNPQTFTGQNQFTIAGAGALTTGLSLTSATPYLGWTETDQAADSQRWLVGPTSGVFHICPVLDAATAPQGAVGIHFTRSGATLTEIQYDATTHDVNGVLDVSGNIVHAADIIGSITIYGVAQAAFAPSLANPVLYRTTTGHPTLGGMTIGSLVLRPRNDNATAGVLFVAGATGVSEAVVGAVGLTQATFSPTTEFEINTTLLDINANIDVSGTAVIGGAVRFSSYTAGMIVSDASGNLTVSAILPPPGSSVPATVQGDILYASAANTLSALAKDTNATRYLSNTGASNNPAWAQVNLTNGITGTLPVANGGIGVATITGLMQGNGTSAVTGITNSSTVGQVLRVTGASTYAWGALDLADSDAITGDLPDANLSANVPLLNAANIFTTVQAISGTIPIFRIFESDAAADEKNWLFWANTGILRIATLATDAAPTGDSGVTAIFIDRTGVASIAEVEINGTVLDFNGNMDVSGTVRFSSFTAGTLVTDGSGNVTVGAALPGSTVPATVQGDILYASAANTLTALAKNTTATRYLANTGTSNNPAWAQVALATGVSGDLPFANLTQGSALSVLGVTGNATADVASIAAGTDHQVLRRSGTALTFGAVNLAQAAAVTGLLPDANLSTNVALLNRDPQTFTGSNAFTKAWTLSTILPPIILSSGTPIMLFNETDRGTDLKVWYLGPSAGTFLLGTASDAGALGAVALQIIRGATTVITSIELITTNLTFALATTANVATLLGNNTDSILAVSSGGAGSAGDSVFRWNNSGNQAWAAGIDRSNGTALRFTPGANIDTTTNAVNFTSTSFIVVGSNTTSVYDNASRGGIKLNSGVSGSYGTIIDFCISNTSQCYIFGSDGEFRIAAAGNFPIHFYTNNTERLVLTADGRLYGSALHNNAGAVTGTTNQYIASGTYNPTPTSITNVSGAATPHAGAQWMRVGNVVTVAGGFGLTAAAPGLCQFTMSLPIASTFAAAANAGGIGCLRDSALAQIAGISAYPATNTAIVTLIAANTSAYDYYYTYTYKVL